MPTRTPPLLPAQPGLQAAAALHLERRVPVLGRAEPGGGAAAGCCAGAARLDQCRVQGVAWGFRLVVEGAGRGVSGKKMPGRRALACPCKRGCQHRAAHFLRLGQRGARRETRRFWHSAGGERHAKSKAKAWPPCALLLPLPLLASSCRAHRALTPLPTPTWAWRPWWWRGWRGCARGSSCRRRWTSIPVSQPPLFLCGGRGLLPGYQAQGCVQQGR